MALFARIPQHQAEDLLMNWPSHRWLKKSIFDILNASKQNKENIQIKIEDKSTERLMRYLNDNLR